MSNIDGTFNGDGRSGFVGLSAPLDRPMLSQHSSNSTTGMKSDYSSPTMIPQGREPYPFPDSSIPAGLMSSVSAQESEWWNASAMMPQLNTSVAMLADLELSQSAGTTNSPATPDDYMPRRVSVASNPELADWQEKVRVQRRKVQNRSAQRAYRERKEKAITDLRELLEKRELQYQALQADHKALQEQYEKLRASKGSSCNLSMTTTCDPSDLLTTGMCTIEAGIARPEDHGGTSN